MMSIWFWDVLFAVYCHFPAGWMPQLMVAARPLFPSARSPALQEILTISQMPLFAWCSASCRCTDSESRFWIWDLVKRLTGYVRFSDHGSLTIRIQVYEIMKFTNPHFKFLWEKTGGGLLYDFQDCLNLVKDGSRKDGSHVNVAR